MHGDERRTAASQQPLRCSRVLIRGKNLCRGILQKKSQRFQRPGELADGMFGIGNPWIAADQVFHPASFEVALKKTIRVEQVGNDLPEAGEVGGEFRVEFRSRIEEPGHGRVFDRAHRIRVIPSLRHRTDVAVSDDFDPAVREPFPEQPQGGKCEQEIADRPSADDKDASAVAWHRKVLP